MQSKALSHLQERYGFGKKKASRMLECSGETLRKHILYVVCTLLRAACPFSASKVLKHFSLQYRSCPRSVGAFAAVDAQLHAGQRRVAVRFLLVSVRVFLSQASGIQFRLRLERQFHQK